MFKRIQISVETRLNLCKFIFYFAKFSGSVRTDQNLVEHNASFDSKEFHRIFKGSESLGFFFFIGCLIHRTEFYKKFFMKSCVLDFIAI